MIDLYLAFTFCCSLQHRISPRELDNEALAFRPVLGSMLAKIYNNPHNKDANQSRLEKILQFWASKEVYNQETVTSLEREMTAGLPCRSAAQMEAVGGLNSSNLTGLLCHLLSMCNRILHVTTSAPC